MAQHGQDILAKVMELLGRGQSAAPAPAPGLQPGGGLGAGVSLADLEAFRALQAGGNVPQQAPAVDPNMIQRALGSLFGSK